MLHTVLVELRPDKNLEEYLVLLINKHTFLTKSLHNIYKMQQKTFNFLYYIWYCYVCQIFYTTLKTCLLIFNICYFVHHECVYHKKNFLMDLFPPAALILKAWSSRHYNVNIMSDILQYQEVNLESCRAKDTVLKSDINK